jgi:hypothetical protein
MTVIPLQPRCATAAGTSVFLHLDDQMLTAGQVVLALASYLVEFGDNFHGEVDPIHAITAQIRYGDLCSWQNTRTPQDTAAVLARAREIARDYFGRCFPDVYPGERP